MGAKLSSQSQDEPIADINVTPFVDVVLVLLVIFIVMMPTLMKDTLTIHLPKSTAQSEASAPYTLGIAISASGSILLSGKPVSLAELASAAKLELGTHPDVQAVLSADQDSRHGDLVKVIDTIKNVGLNKFAVQIQRDTNL